jgi:hypothetical protein
MTIDGYDRDRSRLVANQDGGGFENCHQPCCTLATRYAQESAVARIEIGSNPAKSVHLYRKFLFRV